MSRRDRCLSWKSRNRWTCLHQLTSSEATTHPPLSSEFGKHPLKYLFMTFHQYLPQFPNFRQKYLPQSAHNGCSSVNCGPLSIRRFFVPDNIQVALGEGLKHCLNFKLPKHQQLETSLCSTTMLSSVQILYYRRFSRLLFTPNTKKQQYFSFLILIFDFDGL